MINRLARITRINVARIVRLGRIAWEPRLTGIAWIARIVRLGRIAREPRLTGIAGLAW